jgi:hypothetical protein
MKSDGGKISRPLVTVGSGSIPWMTKILDMSRSRRQSVELTNPSYMSRVTGGAELIQMVQY